MEEWSPVLDKPESFFFTDQNGVLGWGSTVVFCFFCESSLADLLQGLLCPFYMENSNNLLKGAFPSKSFVSLDKAAPTEAFGAFLLTCFGCYFLRGRQLTLLILLLPCGFRAWPVVVVS